MNTTGLNVWQQGNQQDQLVGALNASALISITDKDGIIIFANEKFCDISGYSVDELLGQNHRLLKSGEQPDGLFVGMWVQISAGGIWKGEICNRAKDGSTYWVDATIVPFLDEAGMIEKYVAIRYDITERKKMEAAHAASLLEEGRRVAAAEYQNFFLLSNDIICIANEAGYFEEVNPMFTKVLSYSEQELLTTPFIEFVHPDDYISTLKAFNELKAGAVLSDFENRYKCANGTYKWLRWAATPNIETGKLYASARDVTEKKAIERRLKDSESRTRAILHAVPDMMFTVTTDGYYIDFKVSDHERLLLPPEDMLSANKKDVLPEDVYNLQMKCIADASITGLVQSCMYELEENEGVRFYEARFSKLSENKVLQIIRDVTESKEAEREIATREEQLRLITENINEVVYQLSFNQGEELTIDYVSPKVEKLLGFTVEDYTTSNPAMVKSLKPGDLERGGAFNRMVRAAKEPEVFTFTYEFYHPVNKGWIWLEEKTVPYFEDGKVVGQFGTVTDITERKSRDAMESVSRKIASLVNHSQNSLEETCKLIHNEIAEIMPAENFAIALCDKAKTRFTFPYASQNGKHEDYQDRDFSNGVSEYIIREKKSLYLDEAVFDELSKDGELELIGKMAKSWLGVPLMDDKDAMGVIYVQVFDDSYCYTQSDLSFLEFVSSQISKTISRKTWEQEILNREHQLRMITDNIPQMVYQVSLDENDVVIVDYVSSRINDILGFTQQDYMDKSPRFIESLKPEALPAAKEFNRQVRSASKPQVFQHEYEFYNPVKEKWIWLGEVIVPYFNDQGKVIGHFGTVSDISARKKRMSKLKNYAEELKEEHKEALQYQSMLLSTQINPHFIFNALNSVQYYILNQEIEPAMNFVSEFSTLMRAVLRNSMHLFIPLEEEVQLLTAYLDLERLRFNNKFSYEIELNIEEHESEVMIPPMLLQPFLENSIIHGVGPLEEGGEVLVSFERKGDIMLCVVDDNGVGREAAAGLKEMREGDKPNSYGIGITKKKVDLLNQIIEGGFEINVEDKVNSSGKPTGTRITVVVPWKER